MISAPEGAQTGIITGFTVGARVAGRTKTRVYIFTVHTCSAILTMRVLTLVYV